ncbi:hypothetical protein [Dactylosporangium sp. NPDC048998]|uniref:hypothetical protein n=1 Tax=Dactylosporangium sp. NPDC048998 TaxID=3363976 RepID=UPI0037158E51
MPELIAPTTRLHAAWLAARDDWGRGATQHGSGLGEGDEVDSPEGFAAWVAGLHGGVLEDVRDTWLGRSRRYWIALP